MWQIEEVADSVGRLSWPDAPARWWLSPAAAQELDQFLVLAFEQGWRRVETDADSANPALRRTLHRAGLRPEGKMRGSAVDSAGDPVELTRLARLVDDPAPGTRPGFLSMLNATLPTKRVIAQGLITDGGSKFLMCQLTYKKEWDLPGGVVDRLESPASAVVREVGEELSVQVNNEGLITVDWLPPYRQWDDALLCLYSLGEHPDILDRAVFEASEIVAAHWCDLAMAREHAAPYVVRLLEQVITAQQVPSYLEDGRIDP